MGALFRRPEALPPAERRPPMLLHRRKARHLPPRARVLGVIAVFGVAAAAAIVPVTSARPASATPAPDAYTVSTVLIGSAGAIGALYQPQSPTAQESTAFVLTHEDNNFI